MDVPGSALARHLAGSGIACETVLETGSTNSDLLARARLRAPDQVVLRAALRQTEGRGRHGRRWHGSADGALLFSVALPWQLAAAASASVTLACGLAVAQALQVRLAGHPAVLAVKWPNDILLDGAKLAGILAEMTEDPAGARTLVVGMGFNLANDAQQLAHIAATDAHLPPTPATDLAHVLGRAAVLAERDAWLARLARALVAGAQEYARSGFAPLRAAFNAVCAYRDERVQLRGAGARVVDGIARGVDDQGRFLLDVAGDTIALSSGELSLRGAEPATVPGGGSAA